jgi:hypothetical protein
MFYHPQMFIPVGIHATETVCVVVIEVEVLVEVDVEVEVVVMKYQKSLPARCSGVSCTLELASTSLLILHK